MRRSRYWTTIQGLLLVLATLAGATGCSQRSADRSKNAPVTQATAVEEQATGSEAQAAAPANLVPIAAQLGSPSATTSIPGNQLPPPDPKFGGAINLKASDSKPWWPPRVVPPKGAPNVLLIMTDDCGFGSPSTFGGVIPTPALDRVAKSGLRYTQFHSTSLCSPTRAALITGRNHHVSGFGVVGEAATGFPGYDSVIRRECGTVGEILKQNGYATSWFGKDHNTPFYQASVAGPFDQWPNGMGFEYFYGFVGGDTSQWTPNLFRNTTPIYPFEGKPEWNLTTAMADEAIGYMKGLNEVAPDKPFFVYYVPGGVHAPHHPTKEWIKKISDMHLFDDGWNKLRENIFANQKRLGIIPQDTKLTPWPKELPEWDSLSFEEKKLFIKQADVFAAYLAYTDHEIGRVIQAVEDMGELDNTVECMRDARTLTIVKSVIEMAHNLGLTVTAEGIETAEQQGWMHHLGCDWRRGTISRGRCRPRSSCSASWRGARSSAGRPQPAPPNRVNRSHERASRSFHAAAGRTRRRADAGALCRTRLPRLRHVGRQGARAARRLRRPEAGAAPHPVRDERDGAGGRRQAREVGARRRRRDRQVPSARRPGGLRRDGAHGAGLLAALSADRRPGQLRLRATATAPPRCATPKRASRRSRACCSTRSTTAPSISCPTTTARPGEPRLLPARLPFVLLNGAAGIAVGMATEIPRTTCARWPPRRSQLLRDDPMPADDVLEHLPGPGLPRRRPDHLERRRTSAPPTRAAAAA